MARDLLPLADIATPNRFELSSLTSRRIEGPRDAVAAARLLGVSETVVTSVPCPGGAIGSVVVTSDGAWLCASPKLENVPSGTGDLLAAIYLAARLSGLAPDAALSRTSSCVHDIIEDSVAAQADELTLVASQDLLRSPRRLVPALPVG
jgi:pyridoxine kinase